MAAGVWGASSHQLLQPLLQGASDRSWGHPHAACGPQAKILSQRLGAVGGGPLWGAGVAECPVSQDQKLPGRG